VAAGPVLGDLLLASSAPTSLADHDGAVLQGAEQLGEQAIFLDHTTAINIQTIRATHGSTPSPVRAFQRKMGNGDAAQGSAWCQAKPDMLSANILHTTNPITPDTIIFSGNCNPFFPAHTQKPLLTAITRGVGSLPIFFLLNHMDPSEKWTTDEWESQYDLQGGDLVAVLDSADDALPGEHAIDDEFGTEGLSVFPQIDTDMVEVWDDAHDLFEANHGYVSA